MSATTPIHVRIPSDMLAEVDALAARDGRDTRSDIVIRAIDYYLASTPAPARPAPKRKGVRK